MTKRGCKRCPEGSQFDFTTEDCICEDGTFMTDKGTCESCADGYYRYGYREDCVPCPDNLPTAASHTFCTCSPGMFWNFTLSTCEPCPLNYYTQHSGATSCKPCTGNSTSPSNSNTCFCHAGFVWNSTGSCEECPENQFSRLEAEDCVPCPQGLVAPRGSDVCYKCTDGQTKADETCLQCRDPESCSSDSKLITTLIVGSTVALLLPLTLVVGVIVCYCKRRGYYLRQGRRDRMEREVHAMDTRVNWNNEVAEMYMASDVVIRVEKGQLSLE